MPIIIAPLTIILHLIITAINITEFFLLIRLTLSYKNIQCLKPFNTAGNSLTNKATTLTQNLFRKITNKTLSNKGSILATLIILQLIKITLTQI